MNYEKMYDIWDSVMSGLLYALVLATLGLGYKAGGTFGAFMLFIMLLPGYAIGFKHGIEKKKKIEREDV